METLEQKQLLAALSDTLRDNVEASFVDPPTVEICTAAFPQQCHDVPMQTLDWSGVHFGPKNGVLISPNVLLSATHMGSMQIFGRPVEFGQYDRDVVAFVDLPSTFDVRVNLLNEPLPSDIQPVALPEPTDLADVVDALVLTLTWEDTVHVGVAREAVDPGTYTTPYLLTRSDPDYPDLWEPGSGGDSGTGSFFVYDEELVVGSVMQGGTNKTRSGAWLGNTEAQQEIRDVIDELGGQQFQTVDWIQSVEATFQTGGRRMRR